MMLKINHEDQIQSSQQNLQDTSSKMNLGHLFDDRGNYINELNLFLAHFNYIPNCISESRIDCKKADKWFFEKYKGEIKRHYFNKIKRRNQLESEIDDIFYILFDDLIVNFDTNNSTVRFLFHKTYLSQVEAVVEELNKFRIKKSKEKPELFLLTSGFHGMECKPMEISKPKMNIQDNYNDDFKEINQIILKRLSKNNDKGLVLLHGKPGTGKTSYIRYLISSLKKNVIFIPPTLANALTNPALISTLIDNPNSILIIEDAENIVIDREKDGDSPVSALLNISDGLLSDCLNIQVICSFNTDLSQVDSALMRKGRLIAKYEFKELEISKAQALSEKLGFKTSINSPMTLTDIYNQEEKVYHTSRKRNTIGFQGVNEI